MRPNGNAFGRLRRFRTVSSERSLPSALPVRTYVEEGARIAAILLVWGVIAGALAVLVGSIGRPGSTFGAVGPWLGSVLGFAGVLNAVLYVLYRTIDYWQA